MNKKELEKRWISLRPEIDEAIRAGLTAQDFWELNDISRDQWYRMKPAGFKWNQIQKELKIKRKTRNKSKPEPEKKPIDNKPNAIIPSPEPVPEKKDSEKVAVVVCKSSDLGSVLTSLLD